MKTSPGILAFIVLALVLSAGCGGKGGDNPSSDEQPVARQPEIAVEQRELNQATADYESMVTQDSTQKYSLEEKVAATEQYLEKVQTYLGKHPEKKDELQKQIDQATGVLNQLHEKQRKAKVDAIRARFQAYADQVMGEFNTVESFGVKIASFKEAVKSILGRPRAERSQAYRTESLPALERLAVELRTRKERVTQLRDQVPSYDDASLTDQDRKEIREGLKQIGQIVSRTLGEIADLERQLASERTRIDGLIAAPAGQLFSKLLARPAPVKMAARSDDTRTIGCTDGQTLLYLDVADSNLQTGRFEPILSFAQKVGADVSKRQGIASLLYGEVARDSSSKLKGLRLALKSEHRIPAETSLSLDLRIAADLSATLEVKKVDSWGDYPVANGFYDCELYAERFVELQKQENVVYDCDGDFSLYLSRPFNLAPVVKYQREASFFGDPARCDSYFSHFPATFDERRDRSGQSISKLEPFSIGGVPKYIDWVDHLRGSEREKAEYVRHLESSDWSKVLSPNPPASFTLTRTDAASWYDGASSKCKDSPGHRSNHVCKRR